jgi:hypothetical protein
MKVREKVRVVTAAVATLMFAAISGCSNHFAEHYVPVETAAKRVPAGNGDCAKPELIRTVNASADSSRLTSSGFVLIGSSSFECPVFDNSADEALAQAKRVGAELVVLQETPAATKTSYVGIEYPQTSLERQRCMADIPRIGPYLLPLTPGQRGCDRRITTVPIQVENKNYSATFWRKPMCTGGTNRRSSANASNSTVQSEKSEGEKSQPCCKASGGELVPIDTPSQ